MQYNSLPVRRETLSRLWELEREGRWSISYSDHVMLIDGGGDLYGYCEIDTPAVNDNVNWLIDTLLRKKNREEQENGGTE